MMKRGIAFFITGFDVRSSVEKERDSYCFSGIDIDRIVRLLKRLIDVLFQHPIRKRSPV